MKVFGIRFLASGMFVILCCGLLGCDDPDRRLEGRWILYEYEDGLRTENEASFLTITAVDEFVLDSPGTVFGMLDYRYTVNGPYKTDRSARPSRITLQYDILGADITNVGIYSFSGPCWNRTLSLALDYEAGQDAAFRLSKDGGPVLVGEKDPDSKSTLQGLKIIKTLAQFMK